MNHKIILIGDSNIGKTSFIIKLNKNIFYDSPEPTIGASICTMIINDEKFIFWDTAGQERYRSLIRSYFRGCDGIILTYDTTVESSFKNLRNWIEIIKDNYLDDLPIIIMGTKSDKVNSEEFKDIELEQIMKNTFHSFCGKIITSSITESSNELKNKLDPLIKLILENKKDLIKIQNQNNNIILNLWKNLNNLSCIN